MKVSYNWLKDYLPFSLSHNEVSDVLTNTGLEVEKVEPFFKNFNSFKELVIGYVTDCIKHPNADKLKIAIVDIGGERKKIICGAPNIKKNIFIVVAKLGVSVTNLNGESFKIKKVKIRVEYSEGMICSEFEIGMGKNHEGILILQNNDVKLKPGDNFSDCFNLNQDYCFEIGLTPNRTDAFGHIGVSRDIKSALNHSGYNLKLTLPNLNFKFDNKNLPINIKIQDSDLCPFYCGITIENVSICESPIWLKQKLMSIGIIPINNVVDITNFVLFETGNPLHAFDYDKINNQEIIIQKQNKSNKFIKIDKQEITLHKDDLIISDSSNTLCLAGVIGGLDSSVSKETKSIFLESAYFLPSTIRRSSKRHGLLTDASYRFERGVDIGNCEYALKRSAMLIREIIVGSKISSDIQVVSSQKKIVKNCVNWSFDKFKKLVGENIQKSIVEKILFDLGFEIIKKKDESNDWILEIPTYRVDVTRDVDVIEEVLRIYGYNHIKTSSQISFSLKNHQNSYQFDNIKKDVCSLLCSTGFYEIKTNSLISADVLEKYKFKDVKINILNAASSDLNALRTTLLFGGLDVVRYNLNRQNNNLLFFEFGNVYSIKDDFVESPKMDFFLCGNSCEESWNQTPETFDLFWAKGFLNKIFELFSLFPTVHTGTKHIYFNDYILYKINGEIVAELGGVSSSILKDFSIKENVFYCSINWDGFISSIKNGTDIKFKKLPKFPKVRRDLAILVDEKISFLDLKKTAFKTSKEILKHVIIFDVFRGKNIEQGKKSYALGFIFQDQNKTLTDEIVDENIKRIYTAFEKKFAISLRDGKL